MKKNTSLKVFKIATAGLALTAAASPIYEQVLPKSQVAYAAVTVNSGADLVRELASAKTGDVITLGQGFTLTPEQIGGGNSYTIPAGVTIDGAGFTLTTRGIDLNTAGDVTFKNLNYTILKDASTAGSLTSKTGTLTLENVTTLIGANQSDTRPLLVADGGNVVVTGGNDQTVFDKIIAKTASTITLSTQNIVSTNGVELVDGSTVKTSSNFVSKFSGPGTVEFSSNVIAGVELNNVKNLTLQNNADVILADNLTAPIVTNDVALKDTSKLNAVSNKLEVNQLSGTGNLSFNQDTTLKATTISETPTITIVNPTIDYSKYVNTKYIDTTTISGQPKVVLQNETAKYKLNTADSDWTLVETNQVDKSSLEFEFTEGGYDYENQIFKPITDYTNASTETKSAYDKALEDAKKVYADPNATDEQVIAAEDALFEARANLKPDTNPTTVSTTATTQSTTPTTVSTTPTTVSTTPTTVSTTPTTVSTTPTTVSTTPTTVSTTPTTVSTTPTTVSTTPTTVSTTPTTVSTTPTTVSTTPTTVSTTPTTVSTTPTTVSTTPTTVSTTPTTVSTTPTTVSTTPTTVSTTPTTVSTTPTTVSTTPTTVSTTPTTVSTTPTTVSTTETTASTTPTTVSTTPTTVSTTETTASTTPTTVTTTTTASTTPTTVATTKAPETTVPTTVAPTTVQTSKAFPATVVDGPEILTVTDITTKVVTEAPVTRIVTEAPVTKIVTEAPVTRIVTEAPVSRIVTDAPVTRIVTEAPVTRFVSNEVSTAVLTDTPVTQIITEAPATRIVTDAPVTRIETETPVTKVVTEAPVTKVVTEAPATQIISEVVAVTQKGATLTQEVPAIDVNSLVKSLAGQKPTLNLPQQTSNQTSGVAGQVPVQSVAPATNVATSGLAKVEKTTQAPAKKSTLVSTATEKSSKAEEQRTLPKTSATTNETNSALPAGLAAILVAAGLMVARKENK